MTSHEAVDILRGALLCAFWISLPVLVIAFISGFIISLMQVLFSAQDPAFGSVPRLACFLASLVVLLPWMVRQATAYCVRLFSDLSRYAN